MASKVEIEIEIGPTGEVKLEVKGAKGHGCLDLSKLFEEAVGEVTEQKRTAEYFQAAAVQQTTRRK